MSVQARDARHSARRRAAGFSLIELMVAVVVAAILLSIAIPSYLNNVRQSRRTDAKTALLDLAGREERYYNTNNAYTNLGANLGYGTSATPVSNMQVGSGYYQVTVTVPSPTVAAPSYLIVAIPLTADQMKDTQCQEFTVDSTGKQAANTAIDGSGTDSTSTCWS